jgi:hypothetical protein
MRYDAHLGRGKARLQGEDNQLHLLDLVPLCAHVHGFDLCGRVTLGAHQRVRISLFVHFPWCDGPRTCSSSLSI